MYSSNPYSHTYPSTPPFLSPTTHNRLQNSSHVSNETKNSLDSSFSLVQTEGLCPRERYGHVSVLDESGGGLMIVYGGCDSKGTCLSELLIYNIELKYWTIPEEKGKKPDGRDFHSAVLHAGSMWIFGGMSNCYYNDLHGFHLDTQVWTQINGKEPPTPRFGHTAVQFGQSMYVFGGFLTDGFACSELYEFSFETHEWKRLKPSGLLPGDLYHHSAIVHEGSMYVFGGHRSNSNSLLEYRFATNMWSSVITKGTPPAPRWGHKAFVFEESMYICGGRDQVTNFADLYEFHFETLTWRKYCDGEFPPRFFASAVVYEENLYIFGGRNLFHFTFNELYRYNLESAQQRGNDRLQEDFARLFHTGEFSDVTFSFPNEPEAPCIRAHRNILSSRCEPLKAMFKSGMKESIDGVVTIREFSYAAFYSLLYYIYTSQLIIHHDYLIEICRMADLYNLEHLKLLAERKLQKFIDPDNVIQMFLLSEELSAPELRDRCVKLISNHWDYVSKRRSFLSLSPELLSKITDELTNTQN